MRTILLLICILGVNAVSMSQDKSFDLSQYKFPDYKRHQLDFSFNSNGNSTSYSDIYSYNTDGTARKFDYKSSNNTSGLNLDYSYIKSTRKRIETLNSSFAGSYQFFKSVNPGVTTTRTEPYLQFDINGGEAYYLTENKWFLEVDPQFHSLFSSSIHRSTGTDKTKNSSNYLSGSLGVGGGYGRIENVTEFWQAYYILEGLKKQGLLARESSTHDVYKLATLASLLKSKRFFDARIKKMDEMKSLDSLMHESGMIENTDISYFNILNDYWSFANISTRMTGRRLKFLVTPYISHNFYKQDNGQKYTSNSTSLRSEIDFQCNKQMNLFWERNFYLNLANVTSVHQDGSPTYKSPNNALQIYSAFNLNYYPNFRTQIKTSLVYNVFQSPDKLNQDNTAYLNSWFNNLSLSEHAYYYISPQLRAEANIGISYVDQFAGSTQKDRVHLSYNLGFNYAIF